jgi:4-oxalomesaconate tautomerase
MSTGTTVPKLSLLAPPLDGGAVMTRTFIPVRCHTSIGVLGAASVAAGLRIEGGVGRAVARPADGGDRVRIEHPTGFLDIETTLAYDEPGSASQVLHRVLSESQRVASGAAPGAVPVARRTAVVRTARKIFDGTVFPRPAGAASHP